MRKKIKFISPSRILVYASLIVFSIILLYFDKEISVAAAQLRHPALDIFMSSFSMLASVEIGVPLVLVMALMFTKTGESFWDLVIAMGCSVAAVFMIKEFAGRLRPYEAIPNLPAIAETGPSFPSMHSTAALSFAAVVSKHRGKLTLMMYTIAVIVCVSRVYLGVHYATDVIAGAVIGDFISVMAVENKAGSRVKNALMKLKRARLAQ
ncbi:MAG: phosphatase PAP2 family protein [Candidatus Micrarchaeota archaeon]